MWRKRTYSMLCTACATALATAALSLSFSRARLSRSAGVLPVYSKLKDYQNASLGRNEKKIVSVQLFCSFVVCCSNCCYHVMPHALMFILFCAAAAVYCVIWRC